MEEFYTSFALLTAGVALAMSTISFLVSFRKENNRTDVLFCVMCLCLTVFFLLPPTGFILHDTPPYSVSVLIKRIFIWAYYALAPWFIIAYTGYPKKHLAYLTGIVQVVSYLVMVLTVEDLPKPAWSLFAVVAFGCVFAQGLVASLWQYRNGEKKNARWLITAMTAHGVLFILTAINQLSIGSIAQALDMKLFFPMHAHALFFMLVMGLRLADGLLEKYKLEDIVQTTEQRWKSFM